jgi:ArsR family transcriptional regulator
VDLQAVLSALGDPVRLRIVESLREEPRYVSDLVALLGESQPNISRQLRTLRESGLVDREREGKWMRYRLVPDALHALSVWASAGAISTRRGERSRGRTAQTEAARGLQEGENLPAVRRVDRDADGLFLD